MTPFQKQKRVITVSSVGIACNLILFSVKLYIGLAVNSISIFSDGMNNLADSLSCILAVICMAAALNNQRKGNGSINAKLEQTLSFLLSLVVLFVGLYFFYSSVERLMYPAPIWFSMLYFRIIVGTVAVKAFMAVMYHINYRSTGSSTLKVMRADSILDCGITFVTLISFVLIQYTRITVDAFAGIGISVFIVVEAVLLIRSSLGGLLNYVKKETRDGLKEKLEAAAPVEEMIFDIVEEGKTNCYVVFDGDPDPEAVKEAGRELGIAVYIVNK